MFRKFIRIFTNAQPILTQPKPTIPLYSKYLPQVTHAFNESIILLGATFGIGLYLSYRLLLLKKNFISHKLNLHFVLPQIERLIGMHITSKVLKELGQYNNAPPLILDQICSKINEVAMMKYSVSPIKTIAFIKISFPILFLTQNNTLIISSSVIDSCENIDEIAFLVIHETCHLMLGHQSYRLCRGHHKIESQLEPHKISFTTPMCDRLRYMKCDSRVCSRTLFSKEADADELAIQLQVDCGYDLRRGINSLTTNYKEKCKAKEYRAAVRYYNDRYNRIITIIDDN